MKRFVTWFIALCLILTCSPLPAAETAGLLKTASGDVRIQRGEDMISAQKGSDLMARDTVITGQKSYAGVIFNDGTLFTMGPNTRFTLKQYRFEPKHQAYDFSMYLEQGSGLYQSGKIGKLAPEAVSLSTPKATVGIRGTRFIIKIDE
ncbi:MAG: FecR domain-containing protein [Desulfobacter sp.]|nr:MAG: FecR domain-containing protein [Desulfobacter sp.]